MKKLRKPKEHVYFESSIGSDLPRFETLESIINFNSYEFAQDMREQMTELDVSAKELAKACYLSEERIGEILRCKNKKVNDAEIKIIKKKLSML